MPRIPTYTPQTRTSGNLLRDPDMPQVGTGGMQRLAQAIGDIGADIEQKQEREARVRNQKRLADARLEWTRRLGKMTREAEPGAPGFTEQVLGEFDKYRDEVLLKAQEDTPSSRALDEFELDLQKLRASFGQRAAEIQAESAGKHQVRTVEDTIEANINSVRADPTLLEETLEQSRALVDTLGGFVSADEQAQLGESARERVTLAAGRAALERIDTAGEAESFLADVVEGDEWKSRLSESAYSTLVSKTRQLRDELGRQTQQEYLDGFEEWERQAKTGIVTDDYTAEEAQAVLTDDPEQREEVVRRIGYAQKIGEQAATVRTASPAEIAGRRAELQAAVQSGDTERFDENAETLKYFEAAVEQRENALDDDAATYVLGNSERLQRLYSSITDDSGRIDAAAAEEYAAAMEAEQRRLRGPDARVDLLTGNQLDGVARRLDEVGRSPAAAEDAWAMLASEADRWGKYWPEVSRQMQEEEIVSGPLSVASSLTAATDRSTGQTLVRAAFLGQKELKSRLEERGEILTDVDVTVSDSLDQLRATLPADVLGAPAAWRDHTQAVQTMGMYIADRDDVSVGEGVERAADRLVNDRYRFAGSYRIPRSETPEPIIDGARGVRDSIGEHDFAAPASLAGLDDEQTREAASEAIASNGYWITNGDESGLQLVYGNGQAVERVNADGKFVPFEMSWDELRANESRRPATGPAEQSTGRFGPGAVHLRGR